MKTNYNKTSTSTNLLNNILVEIKGVTKKFPGVIALKDVNFSVKKSEVHALIGENGSGKSTLIKTLTGLYYPVDNGKFYWEGKEIIIKKPKVAQDIGISCIYQERQLIPFFNINSNIFLGREIVKNHIIDKRTMYKNTQELLKLVALECNPNDSIHDLNLNQKLKVEIAKGLAKNPKLLILDEPTAILSYKEVEDLFNIIKELTTKGISIIYVSHRLDEIYKIADRVSILRDGKMIGTYNIFEVTKEQIVQKMTGGKKIIQKVPKFKNKENPILHVSNISKNDLLKGISFKLFEGEILGIAGLVGSGSEEVGNIIFGIEEINEDGKIHLYNKELKINSTSTALKNKIALLPKDRREDGLFLNMSVGNNITLANLKVVSKGGFINHFLERRIVKKFIDLLMIKTSGLLQRVKYLSGGNQQKVVISKWLNSNAEVFILIEPTHGIDVGAKSEIFNLIQKLVIEGKSIIIISSEIEELVKNCNRILVMYKGKIVREFNQKDATVEKVLLYSMGGNED